MEDIDNDIEILREIQAVVEGNARQYSWVTETIEELEDLNKEWQDMECGFSVEQFAPSAMMPDLEFWEKIYALALKTDDSQLIEQCEVMMESSKMIIPIENLFETGLTSITDENGITTWTVTDTLPKCDPPCDNCACQN